MSKSVAIHSLWGIALLGLVCFALMFVSGESAAEPVEHVVLISIDGLRPEFYLDESWEAPTIQRMAQEGVYAERARSVFPSLTYPAHTTIVTGVMPGRHGVLYNHPFEPGGQTGRWTWEEELIAVPTLWDAAREAGKTTAAFSWPVTVGAPIDWLVPEVWIRKFGVPPFRPMEAATSPAELWEEIEQEATGEINMTTFSTNDSSRDVKIGKASAYLFKKYKPNLLALHIVGADHFMHEDGREAESVHTALKIADEAVRAVVDAVEQEGLLSSTAFVLVGDHGFVTIEKKLALNVLLVKAGLMEDKKDRGDWRATFHTDGAAAFLQLRDPEDTEAAQKVRQIIENAPGEIRSMFRIVEREELDGMGAAPGVPMVLATREGVLFSAKTDVELVSPASGAHHGFVPTDYPEIYTGFIGWGAGFRSGVHVAELGIEDVAPTIGRLLELPMGSTDGSVLSELLK